VDGSLTATVLASGFVVTIPNKTTVYEATPMDTLVRGTFVMPSSPMNGQHQVIGTTQTIVELIVNANAGQTIQAGMNGATLSANTSIEWVWSSQNHCWYRIR